MLFLFSRHGPPQFPCRFQNSPRMRECRHFLMPLLNYKRQNWEANAIARISKKRMFRPATANRRRQTEAALRKFPWGFRVRKIDVQLSQWQFCASGLTFSAAGHRLFGNLGRHVRKPKNKFLSNRFFWEPQNMWIHSISSLAVISVCWDTVFIFAKWPAASSM